MSHYVPKTHFAPSEYATRVRCLGPGREHSFWSTDRRTHRLCEACRAKVANLNVPRLLQSPVSGEVSGEGE